MVARHVDVTPPGEVAPLAVPTTTATAAVPDQDTSMPTPAAGHDSGTSPPAVGTDPWGDPPAAEREVPAPGLREVAEVRWDVDRDPVVRWSEGGRTFWLADPGDAGNTVVLASFPVGVDDPGTVATALADTLASCDFPPTDEHASVPRVAAALRVSDFGHLAPLADPTSRPDDPAAPDTPGDGTGR